MTAALEIDHAALTRLLSGQASPVNTYLLSFAVRVQTQARRNCPVDTGRLRSSIGISAIAAGEHTAVSVGSNVVYAGFVHNGTRYQQARPFLLDALLEVART